MRSSCQICARTGSQATVLLASLSVLAALGESKPRAGAAARSRATGGRLPMAASHYASSGLWAQAKTQISFGVLQERPMQLLSCYKHDEPRTGLLSLVY